MLISIIFLLALSDTKPIKASLGDPIIDLDIQSLGGDKFTLNQIVNNSFCFFLSVNCPYCVDAIKMIQVHFSDHHCVFLFLDEEKPVQDFIKSFPTISRENVYIILNSEQLQQYSISTLPALLAYKESKLKAAAHGDFKDHICKLLLKSYDKEPKKGKTQE